MQGMQAEARSVLLPVWVEHGAPSKQLEGRLIDVGPHRAELELLHPDETLQVEDKLLIRIEDGRGTEMHGRLESVVGARVIAKIHHTGVRDDRWSPREKGQLRCRCRPISPDIDAGAWLRGDPSPPDGWVEPRPDIELSLNGMAFETRRDLEGELLLIFVDPRTSEPFRALAEVVRVEPTEHKDTHRVSVRLGPLGLGAGEALAEILLELQDRALEELTGDLAWTE